MVDRSIILTTHLDVGSSGGIFTDTTIAGAILDRLLIEPVAIDIER